MRIGNRQVDLPQAVTEIAAGERQLARRGRSPANAAGTLIAETQIADGSWIIEIDTEAGLDHPYRDVRRISIAGGRLR